MDVAKGWYFSVSEGSRAC